MSHASAAAAVHDLTYMQSALQHERRMLTNYRDAASRDAGALQPLANACWRAASFEWGLHKNSEVVQRLWAEGARALAAGWSRRRPNFNPAPDQFALALDLAVAAREPDAFTQLAHVDPALRTPPARAAQTSRGFRSLTAHAQAYGLVARAVVARDRGPLAQASEALQVARNEIDAAWWDEQFPQPIEAAWRCRQHQVVCQLLTLITEQIHETAGGDVLPATRGRQLAEDFADVMDDALHRLHAFVTADVNHHPKLYLWLPGIALCRLAASSNLVLANLAARAAAQPARYAPLPLALATPAK